MMANSKKRHDMDFNEWIEYVIVFLVNWYRIDYDEIDEMLNQDDRYEGLRQEYEKYLVSPLDGATRTLIMLNGAALTAHAVYATQMGSQIGKEAQIALLSEPFNIIAEDTLVQILHDVQDISDDVPWTRAKWNHCIKVHLSLLLELGIEDKKLLQTLSHAPNMQVSDVWYEASKTNEYRLGETPQEAWQYGAKYVAMFLAHAVLGYGPTPEEFLEDYNEHGIWAVPNITFCPKCKQNATILVEPIALGNDGNLYTVWGCTKCGLLDEVQLELNPYAIEDVLKACQCANES